MPLLIIAVLPHLFVISGGEQLVGGVGAGEAGRLGENVAVFLGSTRSLPSLVDCLPTCDLSYWYD